jgi:hypothetical protein
MTSSTRGRRGDVWDGARCRRGRARGRFSRSWARSSWKPRPALGVTDRRRSGRRRAGRRGWSRRTTARKKPRPALGNSRWRTSLMQNGMA